MKQPRSWSAAIARAAIPVLVSGTISAAYAGDVAVQPPLPAIDSLVKNYDRPGMPGCEVGVVEHGALIMSRAFGLANVEDAIPIGAETRFDIGSMSKQFLALAVLMLARDGKLALDDDVHKYVPELAGYRWKVTLRQMLHHTSGLKDYDQLLQAAGWVDGDIKSRNDILWIITRQKALAFEPGTRYSYSDANYFLLGLIAERVSGEALPKLLAEKIFRPLSMSHTLLRSNHWALVPNRALPYRIVDGEPQLFANAEEPLGDGGIYSTIGDLALWERNFDDAKVGGQAVIADMEQVEPLANGVENDYAAGLYVRTYRGMRAIEHSGASYGFLAEKVRFPERRLSVIALCNRRDGPYVELTNRLADRFLGLNEIAAETSYAHPAPKAELERFAGLYFSDRTADGVEIEARDGAVYDAGADREFRQIGPVTFEGSSKGTLCRCSATYAFELDRGGHVIGFRASLPSGSGGRPNETEYRRMPPPAKPGELGDYAGEYVSDEAATAWCIREGQSGLIVKRRGFADRPLDLLWEDAASGPAGILQFERTQGTVTGFQLRNVRLGSLAFKKLAKGEHAVPEPWRCSDGG